MNLLRQKPARAKMVSGEYVYNSFPTLALGDGLEVVVHALVEGTEDARRKKTDLFAYRVERQTQAARSIRILASCLKQDCKSDQLHLLDRANRPATEFFVPMAGLDISSGGHLPSVMTHLFGIWGACFVDELWDELHTRTDVGIVTAAA